MKQQNLTGAAMLLGCVVCSVAALAQEGPTLTVAGTGMATALPDHVQQGFAMTCTHVEKAQAEAMCQEQANAFAAKVQEAGVARESILVQPFPAMAVAGPEGSAAQYRASTFIGITLPITTETAATVLETLVKVKQAAEAQLEVVQQRLTVPLGDSPRPVILNVMALHPQSPLTGLAWFIADGTALEAEALRKAHAQSQEKAQRSAAALGWQITGLKNLTVSDSFAPVGAMNAPQPGRQITHYEEMALTLAITVNATFQVQTGG